MDQLKIAPSFLERIGDANGGGALFSALVDLGHSLGATIDVEGVETGEHLKFVQESAVEDMQGYYLSRPLAADEFATLLRHGKPLTGTGNV